MERNEEMLEGVINLHVGAKMPTKIFVANTHDTIKEVQREFEHKIFSNLDDFMNKIKRFMGDKYDFWLDFQFYSEVEGIKLIPVLQSKSFMVIYLK